MASAGGSAGSSAPPRGGRRGSERRAERVVGRQRVVRRVGEAASAERKWGDGADPVRDVSSDDREGAGEEIDGEDAASGVQQEGGLE